LAPNLKISEETGMNIQKERFNYVQKIFIRYAEFDFVYHLFYMILDNMPDVKIDEN